MFGKDIPALFCTWIWIWISVFRLSLARDNSGGCVYSFQVWSPNQDVLQRLQELEKRCESVSTEVERQLNQFQQKLLEETVTARNWSHTVDRQILQYRLEDVELSLTVKDVRLEMADVKSDHHRLWKAFDDAKLLSMGDFDITDVTNSVTEVRQVTGRLQNGVGDLKAEWLLIKRDVQDLKSQSMQLKFSNNDMQEDATKLKQRIEDIWGEMQKLRGSGSTLVLPDHSEGSEGNSILAKIGELNKEVNAELTSIRGEWQWIKQQLLNKLSPDSPHLANLLNKPPTQPNKPPRDCDDIYSLGQSSSGVYQVMPAGASQLDNVYCEMINNTGWTLLQRRVDGTLSFNRLWVEYMSGFGNLYGEFWLGNAMLHRLTSSRKYVLRVDIWDWDGRRSHAQYTTFRVGAAEDKYRLHVRGYSGNAGDSLSYHDDMQFSTKDSDSDLHMRNCAADNKGGWWFNSCYASNPNGLYKTGYYSTQGAQSFADGIVWFTLKESEFYSLRAVEMKVAPLK